MAYSETQRKATVKWMQANTDDIRLRVPKGTKESWRKFANERGMSMTHFVLTAINEIIDNDEGAKE